MPIFAVSMKGVCFTCRNMSQIKNNSGIFFKIIDTGYKLLKKEK